MGNVKMLINVKKDLRLCEVAVNMVRRNMMTYITSTYSFKLFVPNNCVFFLLILLRLSLINVMKITEINL